LTVSCLVAYIRLTPNYKIVQKSNTFVDRSKICGTNTVNLIINTMNLKITLSISINPGKMKKLS